MKTKIAIAIIVTAMLGLSGCKDSRSAEKEQNKVVEENRNSKEDEEKREMQEYRIPTEKEWKILEGCNLSDDYMTEIKEKGMSMSVQSFVDTAQIMLDYLVEKYDEEFEVMGGEIPGIISGDYMIFASAVDGEYAGKRFEVYYRTDEDGKGYCEDGYFAILKNNEFQQMMQERADEIGEGWKVFAVMNGIYGKEYNKDTLVKDMKLSFLRGEVRYVMGPDRTEEEFQQKGKALKQKNSDISGVGKGVGILYCQMLRQEEYDKLQTFEDCVDVLIRNTIDNPTYREIEEK